MTKPKRNPNFHRWTVDEVADIEQAIEQGMADALWSDAYASAREEIRSEGGEDPGEDSGDTPDAAHTAAASLIKLYANENELGQQTDLPDAAALEVANDAYEEGNFEKADLLIDQQSGAPLFALAHRAAAKMGIPWDGTLSPDEQNDFGYYLYMEAVGHGVAWEDDHPPHTHKKPRYFHAHLIGNFLDWEGGTQRAGDIFEDEEVPPRDPPPRIAATFERVTPGPGDSEDDYETGWEDEEGVEVTPEIDEDEDALDYVAPAVRFLRREGASEPSSTNWQPPPVAIWYSQVDANQNFRTGVTTRLSFHLRNFTPDEERAIFEQMSSS